MFRYSVLLLILVANSNSSKILVLPGMPMKSNFLYFWRLGEHLVNAGHDVTLLVGHQSDLKQTQNTEKPFEFEQYHTVLNKTFVQKLDDEYISKTLTGEASIADWIAIFGNGLVEDCEILLQDEKLFNNFRRAKFDMVVYNTFTPCGALIAQKLPLPYVAVTTVRPESPMTYHTGIPSPISYVPAFKSGLSTSMTFVQRLQNLVVYLVGLYVNDFVMANYQKLKIQHNIQPESPAHDFMANAEIMLFAGDWASDIPRPLMPNTVFIGCMLAQNSRPLSTEWDDFINSAEEGLVVFTLGSYVNPGSDMGKAEMFTAGLAKLPQKVAMRYVGVPPKNTGQNTKLANWIPQNDLLGHQRTKVFVTHGGMNGVAEAIYHGVPIVGIPLYSDQHDNIGRMASKGMAVTLDIATLTSDELYEAIRTVINEPSYKENAMRLSRIHRDAPMSSGDTAVYWIEHVIKHGGQHLRSEALNLNFIQYFLLDVVAFLLVVLFIVVIVIMKLVSFLRRVLCKGAAKVKVN